MLEVRWILLRDGFPQVRSFSSTSNAIVCYADLMLFDLICNLNHQ